MAGDDGLDAASPATRCSVKHPWQVVMDDRLPRELFDILEAAVLRTNFGVITAKTQKSCVFAFTHYH